MNFLSNNVKKLFVTQQDIKYSYNKQFYVSIVLHLIRGLRCMTTMLINNHSPKVFGSNKVKKLNTI
jgi:hypothetical protein